MNIKLLSSSLTKGKFAILIEAWREDALVYQGETEKTRSSRVIKPENAVLFCYPSSIQIFGKDT